MKVPETTAAPTTTSVDSTSLEVTTTMMKAPAVSYTTHVGWNAYQNHGAEAIDPDASPPTGLTALQCQNRCTEDESCDCVTWHRLDGRCWKLHSCDPNGWNSGTGYQVMMKAPETTAAP